MHLFLNVDNKSALGQIMILHQRGDKPLSEPTMRQLDRMI